MTVTTVSAGVATSAPQRVTAVDALRGFVMVLMALDHAREFFTNWAGDPLDPRQTTPTLYLTRWATHLCAPVFVFLAGTSIFLQRRRKTGRQLTGLLLTRGLWLVVVELTLVQLVFNFNWRWDVQLLEVIWAIGASMICMAALVRLSVRLNLFIGALLVLGHNALDGVTVAELAEAGVKRISTGGALARAALTALLRAGTEMHTQGSFGWASGLTPSADVQRWLGAQT